MTSNIVGQFNSIKDATTIFEKLFTSVLSINRSQKRLVLIIADYTLFIASIYSAFGFRFRFDVVNTIIGNYSWLIFLLLVIKLISFHFVGVYHLVLRYAGLEFVFTVLKAVLISSGTLVVLAYLLESLQLPRSVLVNDALLTLLLVIGVRFLMRWVIRYLLNLSYPKKSSERIVIYGAGSAGAKLAQSLVQNPAYRLVAFVDDNCSLHYEVVQGLTVYSSKDLPKLLLKQPFDTILLAMPSVTGQIKRQIIQSLQNLNVSVKTVPSVSEILSGKVSLSAIRDIDIADLLGREQVKPNPELLANDIVNKVVLVTGAGGSIGSELCRQIAQQKPKMLVLYELNEFALYSIDIELGEKYTQLKRVACLGSVNDAAYLSTVLTKYRVDIIYHAAAYKHVPLVESNPEQAILNNVFGTLTAARCAIECQVNKFVLISTDKAVRPTSLMGATKRVAELILQALAEQPENNTCFTMVRFGNVLGSSGSVVPRFRKQIAEGQPITLTDAEMTRYFMSIPEAASLVIQAGAMAKGGEVFLLDMGEPVKIYDLAAQMIRLSGLQPDQDIEIKITGLRPGEKIYEELLIDTTQAAPTRHPKIFCGHEPKLSWEFLSPHLDLLFMQAQINHYAGIISELHTLVPQYHPNSSQMLEIASNNRLTEPLTN